MTTQTATNTAAQAAHATVMHRIPIDVRLPGNAPMPAERLLDATGWPLQVRFARKPNTLGEVGAYQGAPQPFLIVETRSMSPQEYDAFTEALLATQPWLSGCGGTTARGDALCVEITAPGRQTLLINPEGYAYARYVAVLPQVVA